MTSRLSGDRFRPPKRRKPEPEPAPAPAPQAPSGRWTIVMTRDAQDGYEDLPANVKVSMDEIMRRLETWPEVSGVRPLFGKGYQAGKFRMKTWDWRIEFQVVPGKREIHVLRIGHRDTFYDEYH